MALEVALKEVVNAAGLQVKELESVALPALDALTKSVSGAGGWGICLSPDSCWPADTLCIAICRVSPAACARLALPAAHLPACPPYMLCRSFPRIPSPPACPPAGEHGQPGARAQGEDAAPAADHTLRDAAGGAGALPS